jgi:hypothetical protein
MCYYFAQYFLNEEFSSDIFAIEGNTSVTLKIKNQLKKMSDKDILLISKQKVTEKEYEEYTNYSYV